MPGSPIPIRPGPRSLVIARVGHKSLHRTWTDAGRPRPWDLYLSPFQALPPESGPGLIQGEVIPGPKWTGLREILTTWDGWRQYDYVWLPDDDIFASQDTITQLFETGHKLGFELFAPALHEGSFYEHYSTMRNRSFHARSVGFVEIMVPCFRRETLERLLATFDLTKTGWGWGLDPVWAKLLDYRGVGIIDAVPVVHTRPVGQLRDPRQQHEVVAEGIRTMAQFDCEPRHTVFSAYGPDLQPLDLEGDRLLVAAVAGWDYLFAEKPAVLRSIVAQQAFLRLAGRMEPQGGADAPDLGTRSAQAAGS